METRVVTREGFPLLGEGIFLFPLPIRLDITVIDGILDIVNILLDLKRILFKARVYQWFIGKLLLHLFYHKIRSYSDCCPIIRTILVVYIGVPVIDDIFHLSTLY